MTALSLMAVAIGCSDKVKANSTGYLPTTPPTPYVEPSSSPLSHTPTFVLMNPTSPPIPTVRPTRIPPSPTRTPDAKTQARDLELAYRNEIDKQVASMIKETHGFDRKATIQLPSGLTVFAYTQEEFEIEINPEILDEILFARLRYLDSLPDGEVKSTLSQAKMKHDNKQFDRESLHLIISGYPNTCIVPDPDKIGIPGTHIISYIPEPNVSNHPLQCRILGRETGYSFAFPNPLTGNTESKNTVMVTTLAPAANAKNITVWQEPYSKLLIELPFESTPSFVAGHETLHGMLRATNPAREPNAIYDERLIESLDKLYYPTFLADEQLGNAIQIR